MDRTVKTVAILVALPGRVEELRALLESMVGPSRAEAGNLCYDLWVDRADPSRFVLDELYSDPSALEAHRASPHFRNYLAEIGGLAKRQAFVLDAIAVAG